MWTTGRFTAVYSVTEGTSSEILTKKADIEKRKREVAFQDVNAGQGQGGMRVKPCADARG